ncbi:MAG TPA: hypothetical protein VN281_05640 [Verrucomicrobiae bacterium]|nr:hypothetical protein [Verrucomicrobiae bacterium]
MFQQHRAHAKVCLGVLLASTLGFTNGNVQVVRSFNRTVALTNASIVVTLSVTNVGTNTLRGFWYSDQVPSSLTINPLSVTLQGQVVTNFTFESGWDGDVYPGCTPYRWVLELPTNFAQANPLVPQSVAQIVYSITSTNAGVFSLAQFDWAAYDVLNTNAVFGYSESTDAQSISFVASPPAAPTLACHESAGEVQLQASGHTGATYIIQASTDLKNWAPVSTNTLPFTFTDAGALSISRRYFRAQWLP